MEEWCRLLAASAGRCYAACRRVPHAHTVEEVITVELSEAIKVGAKRHPQGFGALRATHRRWPWGPAEVRTCALGAANEAVGYQAISKSWALAPDDWRELLHTPAVCPQCSAPAALFRVITHLNDTHRWPRERIAAWVRHLERK